MSLLGCGAALQPDFDSTDPQERTAALAESVRQGDLTDAPQLIALLDSVDPAERMLAIRALERLTGKTFGYRHYDPEPRREEAIVRWRDWWLAERAAQASGQTDATPAEPSQTAQPARPSRRSPRPGGADSKDGARSP